MTNVGVWGYRIFVSEKDKRWEEKWWKGACEDISPPPSSLWGLYAFELWRSWVTPVSRLFSQHQVELVGGVVVVVGVSAPTTAEHKTSCVCFLPGERKKKSKGDKMAMFVCEGRKLISKVKRIACMPLKKKRGETHEQQTLLEAGSNMKLRDQCVVGVTAVHFIHDSSHRRSTWTHMQILEGVCPLVEEDRTSLNVWVWWLSQALKKAPQIRQN